MEGKRFVKVENTIQKDGVTIITVENPQMGVAAAKDILYKDVDKQTLLLLSGGSTPKKLYEELALDKALNVGAVAMVDERPGAKYHSSSNETMIKGTGFLTYLESKGISFSPIIKKRRTKQETTEDYDRTVRNLFEKFGKKVAILGIGEDGHTAGIPVGTQNSKVESQKYVAEYDTFPSEPKERITLTFKALSEMDLLIVLAFGSSKQEPLRKMFEDGPIEEIPTRFYTRSDIAPKTILITDQKI